MTADPEAPGEPTARGPQSSSALAPPQRALAPPRTLSPPLTGHLLCADWLLLCARCPAPPRRRPRSRPPLPAAGAEVEQRTPAGARRRRLLCSRVWGRCGSRGSQVSAVSGARGARAPGPLAGKLPPPSLRCAAAGPARQRRAGLPPPPGPARVPSGHRWRAVTCTATRRRTAARGGLEWFPP